MFFKRKCMSCERLTTDLHRQNEKNLASSESIKKLEAKNEELRQELSAEREKKRELLSTISSLRDELFASNMENKKRTQEEPTKQIAGQGRPFSESLLQEKWHLKKVRKPTKASIIRALNCIFHKQTSPLGRIFYNTKARYLSEVFQKFIRRKFLIILKLMLRRSRRLLITLVRLGTLVQHW